jgi:ABC-type uncharacterized transport system substrate-binding protein
MIKSAKGLLRIDHWLTAGLLVALRSATPGEVPVQQATLFKFVINLGAAEAPGLTISPSILARANEVIE